MKKIRSTIKYFIFGLGIVIFLEGCDQHPKKPKPMPSISLTDINPLTQYCGKDCERCGSSPENCLRFLKTNLSNLCDNSTNNCYLLWMDYSENCKTLCKSNHLI